MGSLKAGKRASLMYTSLLVGLNGPSEWRCRVSSVARELILSPMVDMLKNTQYKPTDLYALPLVSSSSGI